MNIINAICNLVKNPQYKLKKYANSRNRANSMGEALEEYIKDLFAGVLEKSSSEMRDALIQNAFSYTGNQNNPPDAMLWNGDAIEVKNLITEEKTLISLAGPANKQGRIVADNINGIKKGTRLLRRII